MRQLPTLSETTANEDSFSDDDDQPAHMHRSKNLKSGMDRRTGAITVLNKITWPHEVVYTSDGKPASYPDISVLQFVYGYLIVMESKEADIKVKMAAHLKDLMSDAQVYGWDRTKVFNGIWLNQFEQGRCTWYDEDDKMQFCRTLIWHLACPSPSHPTTTRASPRTRQQQTSQLQRPCQAWNHGLLSL